MQMFIIPFMIILFFILCKPTKKQDLPILQNYKSFEELLYKESFGSGSEMHALDIEFRPEKQFEISYGSEGWYWKAFGKFEVFGTKVELTPTECELWTEEGKGCEKMFQKAECGIEENENSIEYKYYLLCKLNKRFFVYTSFSEDNEISFPLRKYRVEAGLKRKYGDLEMFTLGDKEGVTTDSVVVRSGPGTDYEKLEILPKGTKITLHARTEAKFKVEKWENYWFYVSTKSHPNSWMYGEFINYKE